ncbi:unnamed protein product [Pieris brassicae]|uniref:Uncharacterized protein n=1 Tax=Pieris brassicae TaxID=7116 RepID=A0A9P0TF79_PIEBR|nr:unnamed protein product [Pieris brassicae]
MNTLLPLALLLCACVAYASALPTNAAIVPEVPVPAEGLQAEESRWGGYGGYGQGWGGGYGRGWGGGYGGGWGGGYGRGWGGGYGHGGRGWGHQGWGR